MTQQDIITQWIETAKNAIDVYQKLTEENCATMNNVMQGVWSMKDFMTIAQSSFSSLTDIEKIYVSHFKALLQMQLKTVDLNASSAFLKSLNEIISDSMNRLMETQAKFYKGYMQSASNRFENLKDVQSPTDLFSIQLNLLCDLQSKTTEAAGEVMLNIDEIKTALMDWLEKSYNHFTSDWQADVDKSG